MQKSGATKSQGKQSNHDHKGFVSRGVKNQSYKQYFESDEEMEDGSNDRSKKSSRIERMAARNKGRGRKNQDSESDAEISEEDEQEEEEEELEEDQENEKEWDDSCFVCDKGGNVLCCETCTHVAHINCLGMKKPPQGDWHCEDCLVKQSQKRTTRGQTTIQNKRPGRR